MKSKLLKELIIDIINIKEKYLYVSFFECECGYSQYIELIINHGLIKSTYQYGKHNLFLCPKTKTSFDNIKENGYDLNKYQKVNGYLITQYLFQKNTLYKSYSIMKKLFYDDFDYYFIF